MKCTKPGKASKNHHMKDFKCQSHLKVDPRGDREFEFIENNEHGKICDVGL